MRKDVATITIAEEPPDSQDAIKLLGELDVQLSSQDYPKESRHAFSVEKLLRENVAFFVTRYSGAAVGCGGIKLIGNDYGEVKRMYVRPDYRGRGLGKEMLRKLSDHALAQGVKLLRLETGIHQIEAIRLYERFGFLRRAPFGDYKEDPVSVYLEMKIE